MPFSFLALACIVSIFVLLPSQAHAYIDPGSGGLILQLVLGALVGSLFYVKRIGRFVSRLIRGEKSAPSPATTPESKKVASK